MIIWLDTETTGLDPQNNNLLELSLVACQGTEIVSQFSSPILFEGEIQNEFVKNMHVDNGLLLEVKQAPSLSVVEQKALEWVANLKTEKPCVAGRNPGFDLGFLATHMPKLHKALGYKTIDILTFERAFKEAGELFPPQPIRSHRALQDLLEDIVIYNWFINQLVKKD